MCLTFIGLEEMETMENLHLQFSAIKVATDNFSPANKIGRGGFGVVYVVCLYCRLTSCEQLLYFFMSKF